MVESNSLAMKIEYDLVRDKYKVSGDINREGQSDLVDAFLRMQIGAGEDRSIENKQDVYHIELRWHPSRDEIDITSDTGNKGLRDGILMHFLQTQREP